MIHGSSRFRAPSPLVIRGLTLIAIGLAIELAVPMGLAIYPGEPTSAGNSTPSGNSTYIGNVSVSTTCQVGTPTPSNSNCGLSLGVEIIWNAVGIGLLILGTSWLLEWRRGKRGSASRSGQVDEPARTAAATAVSPAVGSMPPAVWVRCPQCGKPVDWPSEKCPRCTYEVGRVYR